MKRNSPDLKYYYHVIMTGNGYKVKRSLFVKIVNSVAYFSTKEQAERSVKQRLSEQSLPSKEETIKEESSKDAELPIISPTYNTKSPISYSLGDLTKESKLEHLLTLFDENARLKERIEVLENALRGVIKIADRKTDEFDKAKEALNIK